jgi:hypothetical protein
MYHYLLHNVIELTLGYFQMAGSSWAALLTDISGEEDRIGLAPEADDEPEGGGKNPADGRTPRRCDAQPAADQVSVIEKVKLLLLL